MASHYTVHFVYGQGLRPMEASHTESRKIHSGEVPLLARYHQGSGGPGNGAPAAKDELFRLLVESVRDYAIFVLDRTGHVVTWNEGAQRMKGYQASEILGCT